LSQQDYIDATNYALQKHNENITPPDAPFLHLVTTDPNRFSDESMINLDQTRRGLVDFLKNQHLIHEMNSQYGLHIGEYIEPTSQYLIFVSSNGDPNASNYPVFKFATEVTNQFSPGVYHSLIMINKLDIGKYQRSTTVSTSARSITLQMVGRVVQALILGSHKPGTTMSNLDQESNYISDSYAYGALGYDEEWVKDMLGTLGNITLPNGHKFPAKFIKHAYDAGRSAPVSDISQPVFSEMTP
jgi:hypothetical protein